MPRNQSIAQQFANYLQLSQPNKPEFSNKMREGVCFGLSVCNGAFAAIGYADWWTDVLTSIANWDGTRESLNQKVILRQQRSKKPMVLHEIFDLALNFVVSNFAQPIDASTNPFFLEESANHLFQEEQTQLNHLDPRSQYFFMIDDHNKPVTIKNRNAMGGNFSDKQLSAILEELNSNYHLSNTLCLLHNVDHTIRLGYEDNMWVLYNPRYVHTSPLTMYKFFRPTEVSQLTLEIKRILGNAVNIEVASFSDHKIEFPFFNTLIKANPISLIQGLGLHLMAHYASDALLITIQNLARSNEGQKALAQACTTKDNEDWSGLHTIARYTPNALLEVVEILSWSATGLNALADACCTKDNESWSGLHMIARYAPNAVLKVVEILSQTPEGQMALASACRTKNDEDWSGLHMIARYAPHTVLKVVEILSWSADGQKALAQACSTKDNNNCSGLQVIATGAPKDFPNITDILTSYPDGFVAFIKTFNVGAENGMKIINQMMTKYPKDMAVFIENLLNLTPKPDWLDKRWDEIVALSSNPQYASAQSLFFQEQKQTVQNQNKEYPLKRTQTHRPNQKRTVPMNGMLEESKPKLSRR